MIATRSSYVNSPHPEAAPSSPPIEDWTVVDEDDSPPRPPQFPRNLTPEQRAAHREAEERYIQEVWVKARVPVSDASDLDDECRSLPCPPPKPKDDGRARVQRMRDLMSKSLAENANQVDNKTVVSTAAMPHAQAGASVSDNVVITHHPLRTLTHPIISKPVVGVPVETPYVATAVGGGFVSGAEEGDVQVARVTTWLKYFIHPGEIAQLQVIYTNGKIDGGFFDFEHLEMMARTACHWHEWYAFRGTPKGLYFVLNPINPSLLNHSPNKITLDPPELTKDKDIRRRRWVFIDLDPKRPDKSKSATDAEKEKAKAKAIAIRDYLTSLGWPQPLLADSGNGYHLLYPIDLPVRDNGLVRNVLRALAAKFSDEFVDVDKSVHNPARIDKLYGTKACKGPDTPERPHRMTAIIEEPSELKVVLTELLEEFAVSAAVPSKKSHACVDQALVNTSASPVAKAKALKRAAAYVAKMPSAISGKHGHDATFAVACALVLGFDLTVNDAWPIMLDFNERCQPPWSEAELHHKLVDANEKDETRGYLLVAGKKPKTEKSDSAMVPSDIAFLANVPDFVLADSAWRPRVTKNKRGRPKLGGGLGWLIHAEVLRQGRSEIVLPTTYVAHCIWGAGERPAKWLRVARNALKQRSGGTSHAFCHLEQRAHKDKIGAMRKGCPEACPLHGTQTAHGHFVIRMDPANLGALKNFCIGVDDRGVHYYDFRVNPLNSKIPDKAKDKIKELRQDGKIISLYVPSRLLGQSPLVNLASGPRQILNAITREVTRSRSSKRADRAQLVTRKDCPLLPDGQKFVAFNGNGSHKRPEMHGRGYRLEGKTGKGWLYRIGHHIPQDSKAKWEVIRTFFADLKSIKEPFGLSAFGHHAACARAGEQAWRSLGELIQMTRSNAGRAWLRGCTIRIFAPEDYLIRWRRYFLGKLGFTGNWAGQDLSKET